MTPSRALTQTVLDLYAQLPENPKGWRRRMTVHMNFGRLGGAAVYEIIDPDGNVAPFGYQYDTRKDGLTGFSLPDVDGVMIWAQLVAKRPQWRAARLANKEVAGGRSAA